MKTTGKLHNLENNLINRTVAEEIDKHQMAIYRLMKSVFPEMIGYNASAIEEIDGDELDIITSFNMVKEEEPKEYWAIDCFSPDGELISQFGKCSEKIIKNRKQIGNYFDTQEEAELALRKLKAWKRLKNKGMRFTDYDYTIYNGKGCGQVFFNDVSDNINEIKADLDLLFGGEE